VQVGEADLAPVAVFSLPDDRGIRAADITIQAIVDEVQFSAGEPARPFDAPRLVENLTIGLEPGDAGFLDHPGPEFLDPAGRIAQKLLAIAEAQAAQEPPDIGRFNPFLRGFPDPLHAGSTITSRSAPGSTKPSIPSTRIALRPAAHESGSGRRASPRIHR